MSKIIKYIIFPTIVLSILLSFLLFVKDEIFLSIKGGYKIINLKKDFLRNIGIKNAYSKEIIISKKLKIKDKKVIFFENFYDHVVSRHSRAKTTAYLAIEPSKNQPPYIFFANGDSFKIDGNLNEDGFYDKLNIKRIKNNLQDIINTDHFFKSRPSDRHGIKDVTISNSGDIFIGHTDMNKAETCTYASVLWAPAQINLNDEIKFKQIYKTECIELKNGQENVAAAHMVGARINYNELENKLLLSVGMLNNFLLPQDNNSSYGKILEIKFNKDKLFKDKVNNPVVSFIAKGIRNPQGLASCEMDIIFSSHGPKGGDELNHISAIADKYPVNFGWPIASYGSHYDGTFGENAPSYAPMYKNHKKYGFKDPLIDYTPSTAPSQVQIEKHNGSCNDSFTLWMGTMGYRDNSPVQKSIHKIKILNNDGKLTILNKTIYKLGKRIRDIENSNKIIWFWDETDGKLGYLIK